MESLTFEVFEDNAIDEKPLTIKILNKNLDERNTTYFLSEFGEAILKTSSKSIIFDLGNATYLNSTALGSLMNILKKSNELNKDIKFRFNKSVKDILRVTYFNELENVEMVDG